MSDEKGLIEAKRGELQSTKSDQGLPTVLPEEEVALALMKVDGWISRAARALGVSARTVGRYVTHSAVCREAWMEAQEARKDAVEGALVQNAIEGNVVAQIFFLKTQARDRGYEEQAQAPATQQVITVVHSSMPIDEL